jgi:hypothetical protein
VANLLWCYGIFGSCGVEGFFEVVVDYGSVVIILYKFVDYRKIMLVHKVILVEGVLLIYPFFYDVIMGAPYAHVLLVNDVSSPFIFPFYYSFYHDWEMRVPLVVHCTP